MDSKKSSMIASITDGKNQNFFSAKTSELRFKDTLLKGEEANSHLRERNVPCHCRLIRVQRTDTT